MAKTLTAIVVRQLKPQVGKRPEIADAGCRGLYLIMHPSGRRTWVFRYRRPDGRTAKLTLGPVLDGPDDGKSPFIGQALTLGAARTLANEQRRMLTRGTDPGAVAAEERYRHTQEGSETFDACARRFIELHSKVKNRTWTVTARYILGYKIDPETGELLRPKKGSLVDRWGSRPITSITTKDIQRELDAILRRGSPTQANRVRAALHKMFAFLVARGDVESNPVSRTDKPADERQRDRVLTDDELRLFWRATEELGEPWTAPLRLLLLTGQRLSEVIGMRWEEIDLDAGIWTLPVERVKNKRAHVLPLSDAAVEIIASVRRVEGDYVFTTSGDGPLTNPQRMKRRLDEIMTQLDGEPIPRWTLHDLRRTCATGMARCRQPVHVVEAVLNHKTGSISGVAAIYNRFDYRDEARSALEAWASLLGEITGGEPAGNVVSFRG